MLDAGSPPCPVSPCSRLSPVAHLQPHDQRDAGDRSIGDQRDIGDTEEPAGSRVSRAGRASHRGACDTGHSQAVPEVVTVPSRTRAAESPPPAQRSRNPCEPTGEGSCLHLLPPNLVHQHLPTPRQLPPAISLLASASSIISPNCFKFHSLTLPCSSLSCFSPPILLFPLRGGWKAKSRLEQGFPGHRN